jgi:LPXTG-site transpeptidase (sortase) family protein
MEKKNSLSVFVIIVIAITMALAMIIVPTTLMLANEARSPASTPTRLMIPSIALDNTVAPVGIDLLMINGQTYGIWQVLDDQIGWHKFSASLGHRGNTVLSGHSDIKAQVFRNLDNIQIGDEIVAFTDEEPHYYIVTEKLLVREKGVSLETRIKNAQLIAPTVDERLTLVTCAQPGATHRLIVIARPVELLVPTP